MSDQNLPSHWRLARIGDLVERIELVNPSLRGEGTFKYVDISSVDNEQKKIMGTNEIENSQAPSRARQVIATNDVLVSTVRPNLNAVALVPPELNGEICSTGFCVLRPQSNLLNAEFLFAWVRHPTFIANLVRLERGIGYPAVSDNDVKAQQIPLPPLLEQERIITILKQADELRRARRAANEKAHGLIQALFYEMFGDPATNPMSWDLVPVGSLMTVCEYGTSEKATTEHIGVPVLRMNNVTPDGELDVSDLKFLKLSESDLNRYRLLPGDVLFNRTNSRELVGKTAMWDGRFDAVAASYFIRVRFDPKREEPVHFVTFMNLPYMKNKLFEMARGAIGQSNINSQELRSIEIPIAPIDVQREFAARAREMRALQQSQTSSQQKFDALFDSLLAQAFTGELTKRWREYNRDIVEKSAREMQFPARDLVSTSLNKAPATFMRMADGQWRLFDMLPETDLESQRETLIEVTAEDGTTHSYLFRTIEFISEDGTTRSYSLKESDLSVARLQDTIRSLLEAEEFPRYWTLLYLAAIPAFQKIPRATLREVIEMLIVTGDVRPARITYNSPEGTSEIIDAYTRVTDKDLVGASEIRL